MRIHLSVCTGKTDFTYSFDNDKIIDFQDNFKSMSDLPFSIYYDFETTTGSVEFFDSKMYVVSYCIIVTFHPKIKIPRPCIYRSYDQTTDQLKSLSHFEALENNFFSNVDLYNNTMLKQLEDAAFSMQNRERNTAMTEMFSVEYHNNQVSAEKKAAFFKENPITLESLCAICCWCLEHQEVGANMLSSPSIFFWKTFILKMK